MYPAQQIRYFHITISRLVRGVGRRSNPGIGHQLSSVEDVDEHFVDDPEGLGEESDFMAANQTHREYEREMALRRERVRHLMVQHKYFRDPKLPNMLTYGEKEQIRLLHARDPEEWSAERLAESFPATTEIIQKIISAKWQARTNERIRKHDAKVIQNWEKFRNNPGALQFPPDFQEHLQRFAMRRLEDLRALSSELPAKPQLPRPTTQEFLSIITSCSKYAEKEDQPLLEGGRKWNEIGNLRAGADEDESYLLEKVYDKRRMRLQELKKIKLPAQELTSPAANELAREETKHSAQTQANIEKHAISTIQNPCGTGIIPKSILNDLNLPDKYESSEIIISAEDQRRFEITRVKDRIHIPRRLFQKGATYRVEDAYYDDDGEFLYRVPGMSGIR